MAGNAWFFCAFSASVLWGFSYALSEKILKEGLSPIFYMSFTGVCTLAISLGLCLYMNKFAHGVQLLVSQPKLLLIALLTSVCYVFGNLLIYMAISMKSATLANIIEITYPLFTLLFAFLMFKDVQLNMWTALGTGLVLSGVGVILVKS